MPPPFKGDIFPSGFCSATIRRRRGSGGSEPGLFPLLRTSLEPAPSDPVRRPTRRSPGFPAATRPVGGVGEARKTVGWTPYRTGRFSASNYPEPARNVRVPTHPPYTRTATPGHFVGTKNGGIVSVFAAPFSSPPP